MSEAVTHPHRMAPTPVRLPRIWPWACYAALNAGLALYGLRFGPDNVDWRLWAQLPAALESGTVYSVNPGLPFSFVWSPVAAWLMAGVSLLGYWVWVAVHVAVVFLLDRRMVALTFLSWPFWVDTALGNTVTFAFVAGILALRGNRIAGIAFLAMLLLVPRPLQVPLALLLLFTQPALRWPFVGMFVAHGALVLVSGLGDDWVRAALDYGRVVQSIGPPAWFGVWWFVAALLITPWLIARRWVGLAGLVVSPYWLPYYLFMPLVDLAPRLAERSRAAVSR